jgi:hypothetical protein
MRIPVSPINRDSENFNFENLARTAIAVLNDLQTQKNPVS